MVLKQYANTPLLQYSSKEHMDDKKAINLVDAARAAG
jgi:hypothetical protein